MPTHTPADPDYAQRVRDSFARQAAMQLIGAELISVAPGEVVIDLPHGPAITQQHGFVHGGILTAALDSACGYAAASLMSADVGVLSIEFKVSMLAPARGPRLRMTGSVLKAGRTISVVEGRAVQPHPSRPGEEQLVATMSATMMTITGREGVKG